MSAVIDRPRVDAIALEMIEVEPKDDRVVVLVDMPHVAQWGRETTMELVYRAPFEVAVGDAVVCPPAPLSRGEEFTGVIVSLDARTHPYQGSVKNLVRKVNGS